MNTVSVPPVETPEQLLARLLRCPKLKASVCKVARSQGVPRNEEEDVYQVTMLRMSQATLPATEAEARKYVHGIAKFAAIDHLRKTEEDEPTESLESLKKEAHPVRERIEQRAFMRQVLARGRAMFGEKWDWWERSKVHKETSAEIGRAVGVTPGHVRDEVSVMNRWFDGTWGKRTGSIGGMLVLLLALGLGAKWLWTPHGFDESQLSMYSEVRTDHRVVGMDAAALRERGRAACDAGAWGACENDLAAAAALDREGHTPELQQMQLDARTKQMRFDADGGGPGEQMNAKPGR
jgi:DNA-directed RNA polymerase specialized sigma24 family protein